MDIKFSISSYKGFYTTTYPIIIKSLLDGGVPAKDIYFFIGGYEENKLIENEDKINLFIVNHNSIDFTGLISLIELNIKSDYWFLLHDTTYVGPRFYNFVSTFNYNKCDVVKLNSGVSMNIGSYKQSYIDSIKEDILKFKNNDYSIESIQNHKKLAVTTEDIFFRTNNQLIYNKTPRRVEGPINFYGKNEDSLRIIEHYDDIDLHKIKANWFNKVNYSLEL
jgi:hypothetical protein